RREVEAGRLDDSTLGRQRAVQHGNATGPVNGVGQGVDDLAVRVGRLDVGEVLGDGLAGHGERVAVQQPGVEQRLHDHRDAADAVHVGHDVAAERLDVGEVRRAVADAVEV